MTLEEQLLRDEGLRLKPYKDSVGKLTIGVGRNLDDEGISKDEAMLLLQNDIASHQKALFVALPWVEQLDEVRRAALVNMCFNMGLGVAGGVHGLLSFKTFLAHVQSGNYEAASQDEIHTLWAKQVGPRAQRLSEQMRTGQWV